ncbi:MAG: hypothetical protein QW540_09900 [Archaeoglobaceae archaeon]
MIDVQELKFSKRESEAIYKFLSRHSDEILAEIKRIANRRMRLKDAASSVGLDPMSFLIFLGHLRKVGLVKEVRIV